MTSPRLRLLRGGPLQPGELAQAAVMGALSAVIVVVALFIPLAQSLAVLGTLPMGLLAYRYRLRAVIAATVAGGLITFLMAGLHSVFVLINCGWIGGLIGFVKRKNRGKPTAIALSVIAGAVYGLVLIAALEVLTRLRHLVFAVLTAITTGISALLAQVHLQRVGVPLSRYSAEGLEHWPWLMIAYAVIVVLAVSLIGWSALSRLLGRIGDIPDVHKLDVPRGAEAQAVPIGPVPVRLDKVRFRYPHAGRDALSEISLDVREGDHIAVTGANGSGKTTLMLILAGREPTSGTVHRPGAVGLGQLGGTALVLQQAKSQVLGTKVADDVVWGLPPDTDVEIERLLNEVGLEGLAERNTANLSAGELQRLALAAALARKPALLIADEVTTMVDRHGRDALLGVLSDLTKRHRTALVHITHDDNEAAFADRTINLADPADNTDSAEIAETLAATGAVGQVQNAGRIEVVGVGHEYDSDTPWAKTALRDINFVVEPGDGVLIHGPNGSGKSTLAWIMAGLTIPTDGTCLIDGEPICDHVGAVALSFQAARLQLLRSHVGLEVASAAGFSPDDRDRVAAALKSVGLDPTLAKRRIDQLSGGQMRLVVLAGLLACSPRALILDEPLAGLDAGSQRSLLRLLEHLRCEQGLTVVVVSQDSAGLKDVCPRTVYLHDGVLEAAAATTEGMP